jgi:hypothetical protein
MHLNILKQAPKTEYEKPKPKVSAFQCSPQAFFDSLVLWYDPGAWMPLSSYVNVWSPGDHIEIVYRFDEDEIRYIIVRVQVRTIEMEIRRGTHSVKGKTIIIAPEVYEYDDIDNDGLCAPLYAFVRKYTEE